MSNEEERDQDFGACMLRLSQEKERLRKAQSRFWDFSYVKARRERKYMPSVDRLKKIVNDISLCRDILRDERAETTNQRLRIEGLLEENKKFRAIANRVDQLESKEAHLEERVQALYREEARVEVTVQEAVNVELTKHLKDFKDVTKLLTNGLTQGAKTEIMDGHQHF